MTVQANSNSPQKALAINTDAVVSAVRHDVTNSHTIVSGSQDDVVNTIAIFSGSHRSVLEISEDTHGQNWMVSTIRTLPVVE